LGKSSGGIKKKAKGGRSNSNPLDRLSRTADYSSQLTQGLAGHARGQGRGQAFSIPEKQDVEKEMGIGKKRKRKRKHSTSSTWVKKMHPKIAGSGGRGNGQIQNSLPAKGDGRVGKTNEGH